MGHLLDLFISLIIRLSLRNICEKADIAFFPTQLYCAVKNYRNFEPMTNNTFSSAAILLTRNLHRSYLFLLIIQVCYLSMSVFFLLLLPFIVLGFEYVSFYHVQMVIVFYFQLPLVINKPNVFPLSIFVSVSVAL